MTTPQAIILSAVKEALSRILEVSEDSGTATGGTNTTLEDTTKNWETDIWVNATIHIFKNGTEYLRTVSANTATTMTFAALPAGVEVAAGDGWAIRRPIATVDVSDRATRLLGVVQSLTQWGGVALTGRDISSDLANLDALTNDAIKGLLRSIGDPGDAPANVAGYTMLKWLNKIEEHLWVLRMFSGTPADSETFTITPLAANATFTSPARDFLYSRVGSFNILGYADVASATDGVKIEQSIDATNWDYASTWTASAGAGLAAYARIVARYARAVWINGATAQTVFRFGGRYSIPASDNPLMTNPNSSQRPKPDKYYLKKTKVITPTGEEAEEEHLFLRCDEDGKEIDTLVEGFYSHNDLPDLVLCRGCYIKIAFGVSEEEFERATRLQKVEIARRARVGWERKFR